jgi:hypothetical protein
MAERNLGVRSFETRLAAMDRRLEEIREELSPGGETWLGRDEGDAMYAGLATEQAERSIHAGRAVVADHGEQPVPVAPPVLDVPAEQPAPAEHSTRAERAEQPERAERAEPPEQPVRAERPVAQEPSPQGSGASHEPLRRLLVPSTDDPAAFAMLGGLCASLVESTRRLLDGFEAVLAQVSRAGTGERSAAPQPERKRGDPRPPGSGPELGPAGPDKAEPGGLTLTAGPFASTESLREFERTLAGLPGVRDVALRGYEPANRAILEVQLEEQTS